MKGFNEHLMQLHHFIYAGKIEEIKKIFEGLSEEDILKLINTQNCQKQTALFAASQFGHLQIVKYFLTMKAEVLCDSEKCTPLHFIMGHLRTGRYVDRSENFYQIMDLLYQRIE